MTGWSEDTGLAALFAAAFLSATLLPANSEAVLVAVLHAWPERALAAIALATAGNTLGALTTYGIGRLLPRPKGPEPRALERVRRYGVPVLLLSWVPIAGDALCAAAGWLRLPWARCALAIALGKLARYLVVAGLARAALGA